MAQKLNIEAKSHLSNIEESNVEKIEKALNSRNKTETKVKETKKDKNDTPVIIRREVIINEEENQKKEQEKKRDERKEKVGFVERKQNNYNIVYRNKQNKPMTVNELFGIKKESVKEEKLQEAVIENNNVKKEEKTVVNEVKVEQTTNDQSRNSYNNQERGNYNNQNRNNYNNQERGNYNNQNKNNYNNQERGHYNNQNRNNYNNQERGHYNNQNRNNYSNQERGNYNNQNKDGYNRDRNNVERRPNNFNKFNSKDNKFEKRPLDEKGIEKNIKNIMSVEGIEKEPVREYSKAINKQKDMNKFDDNKISKKTNKNKKGGNQEINEHKLKHLKQTDRLSNMFDEQEGGMLDYYDLTTERGRKGKKKIVKEEERVKQKIFKLTEITIPESITVKDLAAEMKKTTAEIIKKYDANGNIITHMKDYICIHLKSDINIRKMIHISE